MAADSFTSTMEEFSLLVPLDLQITVSEQVLYGLI